MKQKKILIFLNTLIIIVCVIIGFLTASIQAVNDDENVEVVQPTGPIKNVESTITVEPSTEPAPTEIYVQDIADAVLNQEPLTYIPDLTKMEIMEYRVKITDRIVELLAIVAEMDWKAVDYIEASTMLTDEVHRLNALDELYLQDYLYILEKEEEDAKWELRAEEYPVATQIWLFMKEELNWSDAVCAGVLGNMMAEAGGQTLKIQWNIWDKSGGYYGICQWAIKYVPTIANNSLEQQLLHLKNTVEKTMNDWGRKYAEGFGYSEFIALEDPKEVALAFAACYERCSTKHYQVRTVNAMKAYEYFTSDTRE